MATLYTFGFVSKIKLKKVIRYAATLAKVRLKKTGIAVLLVRLDNVRLSKVIGYAKKYLLYRSQ